jgi:hypothetical protein
VPGLELPDDRQDRELLRLVPLEAADFQGKPVSADEQPDHDLRAGPPFLRIADLAQGVLVLGLEVQRLCRSSRYADVRCAVAGQAAGRVLKVGII